jgi:hypothetical protein
MPSFIYLFLVTPEANAQQALPISTFRFSTHPLLGLDKPHTHCLKHLNVRTCERTSCLYAQAPSCPPTHLHKAAALLPALTTQECPPVCPPVCPHHTSMPSCMPSCLPSTHKYALLYALLYALTTQVCEVHILQLCTSTPMPPHPPPQDCSPPACPHHTST